MEFLKSFWTKSRFRNFGPKSKIFWPKLRFSKFGENWNFSKILTDISRFSKSKFFENFDRNQDFLNFGPKLSTKSWFSKFGIEIKFFYWNWNCRNLGTKSKFFKNFERNRYFPNFGPKLKFIGNFHRNRYFLNFGPKLKFFGNFDRNRNFLQFPTEI